MKTNELTCVVIDDEISGRIVLKELLARYCPMVTIVGEAENTQEAYTEIINKKPDFILLDIQMPGEDGFSLLRKFKEIDFDIIFITSYDQYAIAAIKFSPLDYLLKPVEANELIESLQKVSIRKNEKRNQGEWVLQLLDNLEEHTEKKISFHHRDKVKLVKLNDIVCLEADSNYTQVYTVDGQQYTAARLLKDFEDFLAGHENFMRINKSVIINFDHVTEYSKGEPCFVYLKGGREYEISRRKKAEMSERIKQKDIR